MKLCTDSERPVVIDHLRGRTMQEKPASNRLHHLGVIMAESQPAGRTVTGEIYRGIQQEAAARQCNVMIHPMTAAGRRGDCSATIARMLELHQTGVIHGFIADEEQLVRASIIRLRDLGVPVVVVNGSPTAMSDQGEPVPRVAIDDRAGIRCGIEHLISQGHRRVAMLVGPCFDDQQTRGYHEALGEANIEVDSALLLEGDPCDRSRTYRAVQTLLAHPNPPTAILAGDDVIALMVLRALQRRGLNVPEDVSVVGYGGWAALSQLADPELTSVHAPLVESGRLAASMTIELLESGKLSDFHVVLQPRLVIGRSTASPRPDCRRRGC